MRGTQCHWYDPLTVGMRGWAGALALVGATLVGGCGPADDALLLEDWRVAWVDAPAGTAAGAEPVTLPAHLDVPDEEGTYVLRAEVAVPGRWRGRDLDLVVPRLPARFHAEVEQHLFSRKLLNNHYSLQQIN